jgi:Ca2+-binding RTX toxin-like protein
MATPVVIAADQSTTLALAGDQGSVTVNEGVTLRAPQIADSFAIDARNGAGGSIMLYGALVAGGGIYDPSWAREGYDVVVARTGSITATNGYGIALQNAATIINHGTILATQTGISTGASDSTVVNTGRILASTGIHAFGDRTVVDNGGFIEATDKGIEVIGDSVTVTNGGTIRSNGICVVMSSAASLHMTFVNTGTVEGNGYAIYGWKGEDEVVNRGLISGTIDLGLGSDLVDNRQGTVSGTVFLSDGNDTLLGGAGNEAVVDWIGDDFIDGGDGIDTLTYELSADSGKPVQVDLRIAGPQITGWGTDTFVSIENVTGGAANDTITGSEGANLLKGSAGADSLRGVDGNDTLNGGPGNDVLEGGAGIDTAVYDTTTIVAVDLRLEAVQDTGAGHDILIGIENLVGGSAGDRLTGNSGANTLVGNSGGDLMIGDAGDDLLDGGKGNDRLEGGDGFDMAVFSGSRSNYVVAALADGTVTVSDLRSDGDGQDTLMGVEQLRFSDGAVPASLTVMGTASGDTLAGGAGDDRVTGLSGNDLLIGLGGDDLIRGGGGKDTLSGGDGRDVFVFDTKPARKNIDKIVDFAVGVDAIWLDNALFKSNTTFYRATKKGTEANPLHMNRKFVAVGDHAKDSNDYFVIDRKKGILFYDADGSGAGAALQIATFKKGLKMSYHDLFFV